MKDFLIAYDITNEKRLKKVAKYLEKRAIRVQFSVFFLPQTTKYILKHIVQTLIKIVDTQNDDVRIFEVDIEGSFYIRKEDNLKYLIV